MTKIINIEDHQNHSHQVLDSVDLPKNLDDIGVKLTGVLRKIKTARDSGYGISPGQKFVDSMDRIFALEDLLKELRWEIGDSSPYER
tara:strand:- start:268 stop:528 length:261 start_codon:yes stop_codon:yes gene_type:complete